MLAQPDSHPKDTNIDKESKSQGCVLSYQHGGDIEAVGQKSPATTEKRNADLEDSSVDHPKEEETYPEGNYPFSICSPKASPRILRMAWNRCPIISRTPLDHWRATLLYSKHLSIRNFLDFLTQIPICGTHSCMYPESKSQYNWSKSTCMDRILGIQPSPISLHLCSIAFQ